MTEQLPTLRSDFFGKDKVVFFVGVVEDVNDPKHSNRVKVRCVGWHPKNKKGKDSLTTEDLPWARVGMPATMAQQARIGGTHGLLPGCWVLGIFLDGEDGQDPFVLNTFNFTAKASEENNREIDVNDGSQSEDVEGFGKNSLGNPNHPNQSDTNYKETGKNYGAEGDPAGDVVVNSAFDFCTGAPTNRSKADQARLVEPMKIGDNGNPISQIYEVTVADGLCGSIAHARDDIQKKIKERFPSASSRFIYGDAVWNVFTGDFVDLNGILAQLAVEICNLLKQPIMSDKAAKETANRETMGASIAAATNRDGWIAEEVGTKLSQKDDLFHGIFGTSFIDILCALIMALLQGINDGTDSSEGDNVGGNIGSRPQTPILDNDAICITDTIINDVSILTQQAIKASESASDSAMEAGEGGGSGVEGAVASILGALLAVMDFPLRQQYATHPAVMNFAGTMSQDVRTKTMGCNPNRNFSTLLGNLASIGGGSPAGGSGYGSSEKKAGLNNYPEIGFGGYPGRTDGDEVTTIVCEDAYTEPNPPEGVDGTVIPITLPSEDPICGKNFREGTPNTTVVIEPGSKYFYDNPTNPRNAFPSIYIPGYSLTPIPVVDAASGEMVAVLTECAGWNPNIPNPPISTIPDENPDGIRTDDPGYDISIADFFIANTGFDYCDPIIEITDRDRDPSVATQNATGKVVVSEGRIVDVEIINSGTGFRRIPTVTIKDNGYSCGTNGGFGAKIYPIMKVTVRGDISTLTGLIDTVDMIFCPGKQQVNSLRPIPASDILANSFSVY